MTATVAFSQRVTVLGQRGTALARESLRHPTWAYYRVLARVEDRVRKSPRRLLDTGMYRRIGLDVALAELGVDRAIVQEAHELLRAWRDVAAAIPTVFDASAELRTISYCLVRQRRPEHVVEVGVARGATTTAILTALERNGTGRLTSIDLPSLAPRHEEQAGILVPPALRHRWNLMLGPSQIALGSLPRVGPAPGVFIHDGSHSYHVQRSDLRHAVRHLAPGAVIAMDDVGSDAFLEVLQDDYAIALVDQPGKRDPIGLAVPRAA